MTVDYDDGSQTVVNYNPISGEALSTNETPMAEEVKVEEAVVEEAVEAPAEEVAAEPEAEAPAAD